MKKLTSALVVIAGIITATSGWAAGCDIGVPKTQRLILSDLIVDPNLPPGSLLDSKIINVAGWMAQSCTGSVQYQSTMAGSWSRPSAIMPGVYDTDVPGVGVKITDYRFSDSFVPLAATLTPGDDTPMLGSDIQLLFYRTGDITPGSFSGGEVARFSLPDSNGNLTNVLSLQMVSGAVRIKSCYAKTPHLTVQLGSISRSAFGSYGSTVAPTAFNIELLCQGDLPVNVSFSSASSTPSPEPGIVPIDNVPGAATGVAIKIMYRDGSPLYFDTPRTYHNAGERELTIPLLAAYTPIGNNVTSGTARAAITFTITQN
ncbi:hypothetical protein COO59_15165 [Mixta theicola]|uniref:Fimbrial-type adhesion domain-containing protein n=1 Tax=Mixta theicola TaxID=1458355 RepID=A0A2K1Q7C6_9GAMM|nr:fimbrial protein [Mixta theicola]PNS10945.1 hypothetical protein COO59_15165 [Mixta theicola]GLR11076.1 hypothetical protein GCM10007905_37960 [Mixta theicola]